MILGRSLALVLQLLSLLMLIPLTAAAQTSLLPLLHHGSKHSSPKSSMLSWRRSHCIQIACFLWF